MANQIKHISLTISVIPDFSWKSGLVGVYHTCHKLFIIETKWTWCYQFKVLKIALNTALMWGLVLLLF